LSRRRKVSELLLRGDIARIFRRSTPWLRAERGPLLMSFLCLLGAAGMEVARPWPIKLVIDGVLVKDPTSLPWSGMADWGASTLLIGSCVSLLLIAGLQGVFQYAQSVTAASAGQRLQASMRRHVFGHLQRLSPGYFRTRSLGDLLVRVMGDIPLLKNLLITIPLEVLSRATILLGMVGMLFSRDVTLTLYAIGVLPALGLLSMLFSRRIREVAKKSRKREGRVAATIEESLGAVALIQAFSRESYVEGILKQQVGKSLRVGVKAARLEAKLSRSIELVIAAGLALVLFLGARRVLEDALSLGDLTIFLSYTRSLFRPLRGISRESGRLGKAAASAERILEVLEEPPAITDRPDAVSPPRLRGRIAFEDVTFGYEPDRPVLHGVSGVIEPGEHVALVGANGAGKTTIAGLVPRLFDPQQGRVCIDDRDIRDWRLEGVRDQIGMVFQHQVLFASTMRDNIAFGDPEASEEAVREAARRAGADDLIARLPKGIDTPLGEKGASLSGGERQRIALARMVLRDSPIVLLDEPTTALDPNAEADIRQRLRALLEGRTVLLIAHRLGLLEIVDTVWLVDGGRIVARGPHERLLAEVPAYRTLVEAAAAGQSAPAEGTAGDTGHASEVSRAV